MKATAPLDLVRPQSVGRLGPLCPVLAVLVLVTMLTGCGNGDDDTAPSAGPGRTDPADDVAGILEGTWPDGAGGTVIVARAGEVVACQGVGFADREREIASGCDTAYDIMSMTKQFTAAAILKLQMMGELEVSDPLRAHIDGVPDDKIDITLHHLLTHTAGLIEGLGDDYDVLSRDDMVDGALASQLLSPPGTQFRYSNLGYSLLAAIVEVASGVGYEGFLAEHLFTPAGMTQTGYVLPEWSEDRVAVEYDDQSTPQGKPFDHPWAEDGPYWNLRGNGGMLSTPEDMFRWHLTLREDEILDEHAKDLLFEPHVREAAEDTFYGYGWTIAMTDDGKVAWHDGGNDWSLGLYTRFLDEDAMVFWVSNHAYEDGEWDLEATASELTLTIADQVLNG